MSRETSARRSSQFGCAIFKRWTFFFISEWCLGFWSVSVLPCGYCAAIGSAGKKASLLGSPGLVSVYVLLRDRFLVVGVSASNPATVDLSSLRISHRLWRSSLFPVCSAFPQRSEPTTKDIKNTFSPAGNGSSGQWQ